MPLKKLEPKNYANSEYFRFCAFFRGFLLLTFVKGISESRHQRIWNQLKILRFFDIHIYIFQEKFFLGHNSTFCILKIQMRKNLYIFKHFAKSKKVIFLPLSINLRLIPIEIQQKSIKLKPPTVHPFLQVPL